ncbi:MAG: DNA internalization-related competence protein ComEC/Rec2 [Pseudomonadota bacterium]|nr:DNA internalization-related competence protein ComEC/Rec2 [Pseudomonadota bacterium]
MNGLGFAAGVGLFHLPAELLPLGPLIAIAALLGAGAWRWPLLRPLALAAAGFLWAQVHACQVLCDPFPEPFTRRDLQVVGAVASLPGDKGQAARFLFRVDKTLHEGKDVGFHGLVRLSWYRDSPQLRAGERWLLTVRLKPPHGFANPGGFDYERWLFQEGVKATGYVRGAEDNQRLASGPGPYLIDRWRQRLRDHIAGILGDSTGEGLVRALVLGDRSGLSPAQWEVLARTGTNHLIAISGLHVGLVAAFLFFLFRWIWSRSARLTLAIAAPRAAALAAFVGALAYSGLAGFAVSTQRALIMLAVVLGAVLLSRTLRPATGLVTALVGVLVLDPQAVLSYGFWLSFGAVAVLLYALGRRLPETGLWSRWGRAQWVVALGLLPMLLLLFGRASLIAPGVNLIAVPLFSLLLLPGVLIASLLSLLPGLELPLVLVARVLEWGFGLLESAAGWSWSAATLSGRPGWTWAAAFAGAVLLLAPRGLPGRWLGLLLLLALPLVRPSAPGAGEAHFTLLDVGQGLSAVLRTTGHVLVYDTGPAFPSGFNTGSSVLLPFLRERGVERIDTLILSHGDKDHAGGYGGLSGHIPIERILSGEPHEVAGEDAEPCRAGETWTWDGVRFELLHPSQSGLEGNDSSCVLRVDTGGASLLLPGDIEGGVERELAAARAADLKSSILVAAHHGSAGSSTSPFLEAVSPRFVLYATGFADRFGFPASAVRARVSALGAAELDTASAGAIQFRLRVDGIEGPFAYRREARRLWSHPASGAGGTF